MHSMRIAALKRVLVLIFCPSLYLPAVSPLPYMKIALYEKIMSYVLHKL